MNRQQARAADKAARRAPPAPARRAADPRSAFTLVRSIRAANSTEPLDKSQRTDLALGYHGALASLTSGAGTWDDCNTLACAANIALLLCEYGLGADEQAEVQAAQEAIFRMTNRGKPSRRFVLTGPEIRALQALLELHDLQLAHPACTEGVIVAALSQIKARKAQGNVLEVAV